MAKQRLILSTALAALGLAGGAQAADGAAASPGSCSASCLRAILDHYQAQMLKHDTAGIKLASNFRGTENYLPTSLGDGYWKRIRAITDQIQVADPVSEQVAVVGQLNDDGKPAYYSLRLKIEPGQLISQSEMLIIRDGETSFLQKDPKAKVDRIYLQPVPKNERSTRDALVKIVDGFTDAWQFKDEDLMSFDPAKCVFLENNVMLSQPGRTTCGDMLEYHGKRGIPGNGVGPDRGTPGEPTPPAQPADPSIGRPALQGSMPWIRDRRVPIVDVETGTVFAYHIQGGQPARPGETVAYRRSTPFTASSQSSRRSSEQEQGMQKRPAGPPAGERGAAYMCGLFKVVDGKLVRIDHFEWEGGANASGGFSDGPPN